MVARSPRIKFGQRVQYISDFLTRAKLHEEDLNHSKRFLEMYRRSFFILYKHTVNVFIIFWKAGEILELPKPKLDEFLNALIVHDCGKVCLPWTLSNGHNFIEEWEFNMMYEHPEIGRRMNLPFNWVKAEAAGGHHFCGNKEKGYGFDIACNMEKVVEDYKRSYIRTDLEPADIPIYVTLLSIADFAERFLNSRTILRGPLEPGIGLERILACRYPKCSDLIGTVSKVYSKVKD